MSHVNLIGCITGIVMLAVLWLTVDVWRFAIRLVRGQKPSKPTNRRFWKITKTGK